jgi:hypothetical protein
MANLAGLDPRLQRIIEEFRRTYPDVNITSGYRDPSYNASVGGARGSQHIHGNAFDFSVRGLPETKQQEIASWLRSQGLQGFGYYPNSQSMHADLGGARFWGPDYTKNSLGQTPEWFRQFAQYTGDASQPAPQTAVASAKPSTAAPGSSDTVKVAGYDVSRPALASLLEGVEQMGSYGQQQQQAPQLVAPTLSTNDAAPIAANLMIEPNRRRMITGLL